MAQETHTNVCIGPTYINYFRSCMWIGQALATVFPAPYGKRTITEIPIEALIKLSAHSLESTNNLGMMPLPRETWRNYLHRLNSPDNKKVKELHDWLERYIGGVPELLIREVLRAPGVSLVYSFRNILLTISMCH
jgi:hypothetical protein